MVEKFWLDWACSTIARGDKLPFPNMDREDKAEFYGDLASAYELLVSRDAVFVIRSKYLGAFSGPGAV